MAVLTIVDIILLIFILNIKCLWHSYSKQSINGKLKRLSLLLRYCSILIINIGTLLPTPKAKAPSQPYSYYTIFFLICVGFLFYFPYFLKKRRSFYHAIKNLHDWLYSI